MHKRTSFHHHCDSGKKTDPVDPTKEVSGCLLNLVAGWLILCKVAGKLDKCEARKGLTKMGASLLLVSLIPHPREKLGSHPGLLISVFLMSIRSWRVTF